ncbi:MAG: DMT family transporter [Anaerolineae bacterium]|nr:DMT family transporter [Anaerolineae bacterium]
MAVWAGFLLLGTIWGSSFLLIKLGVAELTPLQLVAVRVAIAAAAMLITLRLTRQHFPADRPTRLRLAGVGLLNTALPFVLITWGEQSIDSGLATVLNATVPLFSLVIAHFALQDERITPFRVLGLLCGFGGVMLLASRTAADGGRANSIAGQLAVLAASLCYAAAAVYMRRTLRHLRPMVVSSGALLSAATTMIAITLLVDGAPDLTHISGGAVAAVLTLGVVNTYIAYLLYYWIIDRWGATRATLVTYLMPPVGLTLGVIFLREPLDALLIGGALLIGAGVGLVNGRQIRQALAGTPGRDGTGESHAR